MTRDTRAVTTAVSYVLALAIAAVLISGLLIAGGNMLSDQRERTARTGLTVIGQQLAGDISTADSLVTGGNDSRVRLVSSFPNRVAGVSYGIEITAHPTLSETAIITLTADDIDVDVEVYVKHRTPLELPVAVDGGKLVIEYDSADATPRLVVHSA